MTVPKADRETIILFNEADNTASIYTHSKKWIRHLEVKLGVKPSRVEGLAREYEVPKKWIKLPRKPRKMKEK